MCTTRAIADSVASSCGTGRALPSGYPCDHATAALLVAIALAPRLSTRRALPASQAFARIRISGPACKPRNVRDRSSLACAMGPPLRLTECARIALADLAISGLHHGKLPRRQERPERRPAGVRRLAFLGVFAVNLLYLEFREPVRSGTKRFSLPVS